jgi:hypothetical protein
MGKKGPVYLYLSRCDVEPRIASIEENGRGPVFGPYRAIHFSDHQLIYMETEFEPDLLRTSGRGVYYEGVHYPHWTVSSEPGLTVTVYDFARIEPPRNARSQMTIEDRFRHLVLLCESVIEDRLSILQEDDCETREMLLTSDIEDQIAHWQAVQHELAELK